MFCLATVWNPTYFLFGEAIFVLDIVVYQCFTFIFKKKKKRACVAYMYIG